MIWQESKARCLDLPPDVHEKLEPQRQQYIDGYTIFERRLDKEDL